MGGLEHLLKLAKPDTRIVPARGPVLVPFSGSEHDWAAVELGAGIAHALVRPLRLAGASIGASGRDASRLLANASLAIQHALSIHADDGDWVNRA